MIGPSDLYRLPARSDPVQPEALVRYARLELRMTDLRSIAAAAPRPIRRRAGLRAWLAARAARRAEARESLRPSRAGIPLGGATGLDPRTDVAILPVVHSAALVASGSLVVPALAECGHRFDEAFCEP